MNTIQKKKEQLVVLSFFKKLEETTNNIMERRRQHNIRAIMMKEKKYSTLVYLLFTFIHAEIIGHSFNASRTFAMVIVNSQ